MLHLLAFFIQYYVYLACVEIQPLEGRIVRMRNYCTLLSEGDSELTHSLSPFSTRAKHLHITYLDTNYVKAKFLYVLFAYAPLFPTSCITLSVFVASSILLRAVKVHE